MTTNQPSASVSVSVGDIDPLDLKACEEIGKAVDPYITGSKRVAVRVAAVRRVLALARLTLQAKGEDQ